MKNPIKLSSGVMVPQITKKDAESRYYLTRATLTQLHLMPKGDPVAYSRGDDGSIIYYFDPERVVEAPPELWFFPTAKEETMTLENGTVIERMSVKRAASCGYYTKERLAQLKYETAKNLVGLLFFGI